MNEGPVNNSGNQRSSNAKGRSAPNNVASTGEAERMGLTARGASPASDGGASVPAINARTSFAGWPMIVGWLAMLIFTFHACTHMVAAGDTWVAMACGRHFVNHGVDTVEPFSANSHKAGPTPEEVKTWPGWAQGVTRVLGLDFVKKVHPTGWINQNWLTHILFYKLTTMFGSQSEPYFDALVYWKFALYILVMICLYFTSRLLGVNRAIAVMFACAAMFVGRSFLDVRPAGFSNLMVPTFMMVLALAAYRNALYIWLIVPLIVLWSNLHGGYIYALLMLVPFVAWHVLMNLPKRWSVAAYSVGTWGVMCFLAHNIYKIELLAERAVPLRSDWIFYVFLLAAAGIVALSFSREISVRGLVGIGLATSLVLFLVFLTKFLQDAPVGLTDYGRQLFRSDMAGAFFAYLGISAFALILGIVIACVRDRIALVMPPRGIGHTVAAGFVAFVAMVIFNPFHLTNLTHTFVISVSSAAERWRDVHEWHRAFDWSNPVGTAVPFLVMYIFAWVCLLAWAFSLIGASRVVEVQTTGKKKGVSGDLNWPKLDVALVIIAAMTIYMAIRSRRFIPIAGYAACPTLALLTDHAVRVIAAAVGMLNSGKWQIPSLPRSVEKAIMSCGIAAVLGFGIFWTWKFFDIYVSYWPADPKLTSVFMRLTASDAKPFCAMQFIRENNLSGTMFNYWTEGGFIAWGQTPDPKTGRTPLQLFMDGRAQAAYDRTVFDEWSDIISGGPVVTQAARKGRSPAEEDYPQIAQWISAKLRAYKAWVVLMPSNQFDTPFVMALEESPEWRTVFTNNKQKLLVDITTEPGRKLHEDVLAGRARYPDEFSADMSRGHNLLLSTDAGQRKQGLDLVIKAFREERSPAPVLDMLLIAARYGDLRKQVDDACLEFATDFDTNKSKYAGHDGYNLRIEAARLCTLRLEQLAKTAGDAKTVQMYSERMARYISERNYISDTKRW
jgi:hypothetical protein